MARGLHFGRARTRPYIGEYHRIAAKIFKPCLTVPLRMYTITGIDISEAHCDFSLRDSGRGWRIIVFTFDGREVSIPLMEDNRSASNKLYLACPYCACLRQHLYALKKDYGCRKCIGLSYGVQSEREPDRLARRIRKLRKKLWEDDVFINDLTESSYWRAKPKLMKRAAFEKKRDEIVSLEERHLHYQSVFIATHFGISDKYSHLF